MASKHGKVRSFLEYFVFRVVLGLIGIFPVSISFRIGEFLGELCYYIFSRLRKTAFRNLELALPETSQSEREKIVKGVFKSLGRQLGLISHLSKITLGEASKWIEIVGKEHFYHARLNGRGILFFTGHFGGWEICSFLPSLFGYSINIVVRRIDNPLIEEYVDKYRTRFGAVTLDKKQSARKMFKVLQDGEILGILVDLNVQEKEGVFVDFFGIPACTTTAPAKLALKTNAALIPAFVIWDESKRRYMVYIEPEVRSNVAHSSEEVIIHLTQEITKKIEEYARSYPEQWLWIHKRWNTRPKGSPSIY